MYSEIIIVLITYLFFFNEIICIGIFLKMFYRKFNLDPWYMEYNKFLYVVLLTSCTYKFTISSICYYIYPKNFNMHTNYHFGDIYKIFTCFLFPLLILQCFWLCRFKKKKKKHIFSFLRQSVCGDNEELLYFKLNVI